MPSHKVFGTDKTMPSVSKMRGVQMVEPHDSAAPKKQLITNNAAWTRYKVYKDKRAREDLIVRYLPLVSYVIERTRDKLPAAVDREDLLSYGVLGLMEAVERFDMTRGIKFETFAIARVRGAIIDQLRSFDIAPRSLRQKAKIIDRAYAQLERELCRAPSDNELADRLGITQQALCRDLAAVAKLPILSLENLAVANKDGSCRSISDCLADPNGLDPSASVELREVKEALIAGIKDLNRQERTVVTLSYFRGLTLGEIGSALGVSESRASQIRAKALVKLRVKLDDFSPTPTMGR